MGAAPGTTDGLAAQLRASPFDSASVVTTDGRTAVLRADPIALIIAGALIVGFVASGLFAVVGLMLSAAISARQRRTEFALLRALGLSGRQLSAWLWLENGSLVAVSLLAGTGLGLLIGWLVLPSITVTQQATAPVPPIVVHVPWDQVAVLDLVSAMALTAAVAVTGRLLRNVGVGGVLRMGED
jgi:ABC-type antimicrobial peptide transport system permease subunit